MKKSKEFKQYVSVNGSDRGGTNLVLASLHCYGTFFSVSERVTCVKVGKNQDISTFLTTYFDNKPYRSMLREWDIEKPNGIDHLIFKIWPDHTRFYDKNIFLIRNPFRVCVSMRKYNAKVNRSGNTGKESLIYTIGLMRRLLLRYKNCRKDKVLVSYERFAKNFEHETVNLINFISPDENPINYKYEFVCNKCKSILQRRGDGHCGCDCSQKVYGYGLFDPCEKVTLERCMKDKISDSLFKDKELAYAKSNLGTLYEYWLNDVEHMYVSPPDFSQLGCSIDI